MFRLSEFCMFVWVIPGIVPVNDGFIDKLADEVVDIVRIRVMPDWTIVVKLKVIGDWIRLVQLLTADFQKKLFQFFQIVTIRVA